MIDKSKKAREGEVLKGKYRLDRHIATGGMGEVYEATNIALGRTVAVKLLLAQFISDEHNVQRFLMEARTASMVQHPNIVQVYDVDETDSGVPFIVQEYLRGETLSRRLRRTRERMLGKSVLDILIPVIEALGEAHNVGIVHRDIKPSNIFLATQGQGVVGKILDFGISRVGSTADDVRLTKTTAVLGSPAYMSPEQIQSARNATTRSDVWSIGAMMYELLSGELPFKGKTSSEIMVNVCTKDIVPLYESAPGISPLLAEVVSRCLSRQPQDRYLDGAGLAEALREVREKEFTARNLEAGSESPQYTPAFGTPVAAPDGPGTSTRSSLDTVETDIVRRDEPHPGETRHGTAARSRGASAERHPSYGDIPAIAGAFGILVGLLVISVVFGPSEQLDGTFEVGNGARIMQMLVAGGLLYVAQLTQTRASQYSARGSTVTVLGLYVVIGSLLLLAGAAFLGETALLPLLERLLSLGISVSSLGLAIVGFEYVYNQIMEEQLVTMPGVGVSAITVMAVVIATQYAYKGFGS